MESITTRRAFLTAVGASLLIRPQSLFAADCSAISMAVLGLNGQPALYARSQAHTAEGTLWAKSIIPRDARGLPNAAGLIGVLTIGMSNAEQIQRGTAGVYTTVEPYRSARRLAVRMINGAMSGKTASEWTNPSDPCWANALMKVAAAGLSRQQVQAVHIVMAQRQPQTEGAMTENDLRRIAALVANAFPFVSQMLLSGVNYTGYSNRTGLQSAMLSPEPFPHRDSLLMASIVEAGGWPAHVEFFDLWANGVNVNPRTGLSWLCRDLQSDGVHLAPGGQAKVGMNLVARWYADPVMRWLWR